MQKYTNLVARSLRELLGDAFTVEFSFDRTDPKFGDYATNVAMVAFSVSKKSPELRQKLVDLNLRSPRELADKLREKLLASGEFTDVAIAGPGFLNMRVEAANLAQNLNDEFRGDQKFGASREHAGQTAIVEYPSPNVAKPYSVGHLRSGNQGWAAKNLLENQGWTVITDNHLGDSGSPFGYWVLGYKMFSSPEKLTKAGVYELGRVYIKIRAALKDEAERGETTLSDQAQQWLLKLEAKDPDAVKYSDEFSRISIDHIHEIMARLGISTEYEYGEKFFASLGKQAIAQTLERGIATENPDGSVIIDLTDQGIKTPLLIRKSNGANLYATGDLACMIWREENWHPDLVVYSAGGEQKFYFEQLAAAAKKLGLKQRIFHLWFGTIDQIDEHGKRAKMSSRKGVVLMEDLLNAAFDRARDNAKTPDMSDDDLRKISVGAIKFADFAADRRTGMLFDWENAFSLSGFSGPYVQYAAVRVNKILRDNQFNGDAMLVANDYNYAAEKNLILKLLEYPDVVKLAADKLEPHRVASYVYELAKTLNKYYETTPVATDKVPVEIKQIRLGLLNQVAVVFADALAILGIAIPSKM
ncbi:MAG: arginine--tRNA ligase [Candidatus Nanoperiomorbaceae bacterium]